MPYLFLSTKQKLCHVGCLIVMASAAKPSRLSRLGDGEIAAAPLGA
jgi:hypothetical protein